VTLLVVALVSALALLALWVILVNAGDDRRR
jgi:hypothetical protein